MRRRAWLTGALLAILLTVSSSLAQGPVDEAALGRIRNLGGFVSFDEDGVPHNASLKAFPVSEFGLLSKLKGIRSLDVRRSKLGDREIAAICDIGTLQSLVIADGHFSHDGLREFDRLKHLSALNIDNSSIAREKGQEAFGCFSDELVTLRMRLYLRRRSTPRNRRVENDPFA